MYYLNTKNINSFHIYHIFSFFLLYCGGKKKLMKPTYIIMNSLISECCQASTEHIFLVCGALARGGECGCGYGLCIHLIHHLQTSLICNLLYKGVHIFFRSGESGGSSHAVFQYLVTSKHKLMNGCSRELD